MQYVNLESWIRRDHFQAFKSWGFPHLNICANVDLTPFYSYIKHYDISFNLAIVYVITWVANDIREFRYRIQDSRVAEYEIVHPAITIMLHDDLFGFCPLEFVEDFTEFCTRATKQIDVMRNQPSLSNDPARDNLFYMTSIPWVSFTNILHPLDLANLDSVPRFAWGKFFKEGDVIKMPLYTQGHHALMDGVHIGRFFEKIQDRLNQPSRALGEV